MDAINGHSINAGTTPALEEFDPFANWPPRSVGGGNLTSGHKLDVLNQSSSTSLSMRNAGDKGNVPTIRSKQKNEIDIGALLAPPGVVQSELQPRPSTYRSGERQGTESNTAYWFSSKQW